MKIEIPDNVAKAIEKLEASGFEAFVVGGCVRDLLLGAVYGEPVEPKDWDVATNAKPEQTTKVFPDSVYENEFGTVGVKMSIRYPVSDIKYKKEKKKAGKEAEKKKERKEIVEVTTYRIESKYSDKRHPDEVRFAKTLEEDLSRRDFTVNAMALKLKTRDVKTKAAAKSSKPGTEKKDYEVVDLFGGQKDLENMTIKAVGKPDERFDEDALRMMRAVRFAVSLQTRNQKPKADLAYRQAENQNDKSKIKKSTENNGRWTIEKETFEAIKKNARNLNYISKERVRDELIEIILSKDPAGGIKLLDEAGLLEYIIPELLEGKGLEQARHHYFGPYREVFDHCVAALEKCPSEKLEVRLAALLHDVGKPATAKGKGRSVTFHNHEYAGARITGEILERLKFSRKVIDKTVLLVKNHMFYYNVDEVGESGVRRVVRKVGLENINDLIDVRIGDRLGSGVPKAVPYKLRHFKYMVEKVSKDPISVSQLKLRGDELMRELKIKPGPKVGAILEALLACVIDDPKLNNKKDLIKISKELRKQDLGKLRAMAKEKIEAEREKEERRTKNKYWVQ